VPNISLVTLAISVIIRLHLCFMHCAAKLCCAVAQRRGFELRNGYLMKAILNPIRLLKIGILLLGALAAQAAAPTVLLLDNFNANTGNTTDLNVDLARQTGTLAPISYTLAGGLTHYGHQLQNVNAQNQLLLAGFGDSTSALNFNFNGANSAGGLLISFDVDPMPLVYNATPDHWGCINFGMTEADRMVNVNGGAPHIGILFRAAGTIQAFSANTVISPNPEPVYTTSPQGTLNHIDIVLTDRDGNPFDGLGDTIVEIYADRKPLPVWTYTKVGGFANNYINFQGSHRAHFDNITIAQFPANRVPEIVNHSFEADNFTVFPGYVNGNGPITGWTALGGHGVNPGSFGGPFTDNGTIPDGSKAAFLQEDGALRQVISGFTIGSTYAVQYSENARNCCGGTSPHVEVRIAGNTVVPAHRSPPVGGANPYRTVISDPFLATATSMELAFIKSNPEGQDTTLLIDHVRIVVPNAQPSITVQPQGQEVPLGDTATFSVRALGSAPLNYQWYHEGTPIAGANGATYSFLVDFPDVGGRYHVVVSNSAGSIQSSNVVLTVRARVPGLFNTGVDDSGAALADGAVDPHYQLIVNADDSFSLDAIVENSAAFPIVTGPWVANNASGKWIGPRFDTSGAAGLAQGDGVYVYQTTFDLTGVDKESTVITGQWAIDNEGRAIRVNGQPTGIVNNNAFATLTSFRIDRNNATFVDGINTLEFEVRNVDTIAGYTGLRVANLRGIAALPGTPPTITTQPQGQLAGTGESFTLTALAVGSSPLNYQWFLNGAAISGATQASYTVANVTLADAGDYHVTVTNPAGSATSATATIRVLDTIPTAYNTGVDDSKAALPDAAVDPHYRLVINADGTSTEALVHSSTVFPIVAGPWVPNTASSKWISPRVDSASAAGGAGAAGDYVYRTIVDVTGYDPASVIIDGLWATDNEGMDILINGVSTGQKNTVQFTAYTPFVISNNIIAGQNIVEFKLNNSAVGWTALRVDGMRALGNALPPNTAPFIVVQPQSVSADVGQTATLRVQANGSAPLTYQWFFGPDPIPNENGPALNVFIEFPDQYGAYTVEISNPFGTITSDPALIHAPNLPPTFTKGPDITVAEDSGPHAITGWATAISPGAPEEAGQVLTFQVSSDNPGLFTAGPAIDPASGTLSFALTANASGAANVTATLTDDQGASSAPATFAITVTGVNDCPVAGSQTANATEDTPASITLAITDPEGDTLNYTVGQPAYGTLSGTAPNLIYTPGPNFCGVDAFTAQATDGQCASGVLTVTIQVACANDAPNAAMHIEPTARLSSTSSDLFVISANNETAAVVMDASASTDPEGDALSFTWFVDGTSVGTGATIVQELEVGSRQVSVLADDGKGGTDTAALVVHVITAGEAVDMLIAEVEGSETDRKNKRPLIATLKAASAAFERGQTHAAANTLGAFQNKVRAQIGRTDPTVAGELIRIAEEIIGATARE
jgi:hypothetical protein